MITSIMQPYFLPYLGYFQLIELSDVFVVYDNIQYTKKGWINRNRFLLNETPSVFTVPVKRDSHLLDINRRYLIDDYLKYNKKTLNKISQSYKNAPNFKKTMPLIESIFLYNQSNNLFDFIYNSILEVIKHLNIKTKIIKSSEISIENSNLKSAERVIDLCKLLKTNTYVNPIGGIDLYDKNYFSQNNINLLFHKMDDIDYHQFSKNFEPYLSIIDLMMFTDVEPFLKKYTII